MGWQPSRDHIEAALAHAEECAPLECCGVIADGRYRRLKNTATQHDAFVMDMRGYIAVSAEAKIEAVVHSHVHRQPIASEGDRVMCEKTAMPWLIVSWPLGTHAVIEPCGYRPPLVGRSWAWGSNDCWGLIRDAMKEFAGIDLPDFEREWMWWRNGGDTINECWPKAGFVRVPQGTKLQHCDMLGMKLHAPVANHLALFLEPDIILHQMMGRLSVREPYGGLYQRATILHLRHEKLMEAA